MNSGGPALMRNSAAPGVRLGFSLRGSAVATNVANRLIALLGGAVLLLAVVTTFSPAMQGFYYTFYSLAFLRFFAELGLTAGAVQIISHAAARNDQAAALRGYRRFFVLWFGVAGAALGLGLMPAILLFQGQIADLPDGVAQVTLPWLFYAPAIGVSVLLTGCLAVVEGHQRILAVSRIRLWIALCNFGAAALLIRGGAQLWALPVAAWLGNICGLALLCRHRDVLRWRGPTRPPAVDWRAQVWPFQWRLAVSWMTGFFIFYALTPIVMRSAGPVAAGQFGLSLQVIQIINGMAILAVSTHAARFGQLAATGDFAELRQAFARGAGLSFAFLAVLLALSWGAYLLAPAIGLGGLQGRVLAAPLLLALTIAALATHVFFLLTYATRAFRAEVLWPLSLLNAVLTLLASLAFVPSGGAAAAALIFAANGAICWLLIGPIVARRSLIRLMQTKAGTGA